MHRPEHPRRKKLPHDIPPWVQQGERHFITINHQHRGREDLICGDTPTALLESARFYDQIQRWYLWLMLIMPDHLHFIATFDMHQGIRATLKAWKAYQATHLGIDWQSDYFEHRLRTDQEFVEKSHYIRMNPVRQGLVETANQWPHVIDRASIDASRPSQGESPG